MVLGPQPKNQAETKICVCSFLPFKMIAHLYNVFGLHSYLVRQMAVVTSPSSKQESENLGIR